MCEECVKEQEKREIEKWTIVADEYVRQFTTEEAAIYWDDEARLISIESKDGKRRAWIPYEKIKYVIREYEP